MSIERVLHRADARATGGGDGHTVVPGNKLDFNLTPPRKLGGARGEGTNPEQLFAAGYSACFIGAMKFVAARNGIAIPAEVSVVDSVGIGSIPTGLGIEVSFGTDCERVSRIRRK
ncbi:Ohr family peroxiredoxin [Paraburkholderia sp. 1N]|uniref:Ohr family peroxiredoxin n=1 Tax=Paraburkholderia solitsugae TaxID=2675748 RepID=A0ABX2BHX7_9BURK|nr:Ohr family peroxiredoxin [Paraburkholderia solitsugae]NPT40554.1 Ohr family peroxiredoxin [Paraburkholderia solitsugae]